MVVPRVSDRRADDRREAWQRGWFIGAGLAALALLVLIVVPHDSLAWGAVYVVTSIAALFAYIRQGLKIPPPAGRFWLWLLAFIVLTLLADIVNEFVPSSSTGQFPDPVDWIYIVAYVPALVALALLIRRRYPGRDHEAWIDALILAAAAMALLGAFVIAPAVVGSGRAGGVTTFLVAYPVLDLIVLCGLIWLVMSSVRAVPSLTVLVCAFAAYLASGILRDLAQGREIADASVIGLDTLNLLALLLMAGAIRSPGAATICEPEASGGSRLTRTRIIAMGIGVVIVPVIVAERDAFGPSIITAVLSVAAVIIILLTLWRVFLLVRQLDDQRSLTRLVLDSAADGIVGVDGAGQVLFANLSSRRLLRCRESDLVGRNFHDTTHHHYPDGRPYPSSECAIHAVFASQEPVAVIGETLFRRDGTAFPVDLVVTPLASGSGSAGSVISFRDASERLALERVQREFVSVVSHELRTPLTSIKGSLQMLDAGVVGALTDEQRELLAIAIQNGDRLVRLVNDILDLERLNSGQLSLNPSDVTVVSIAEQALAAMDGAAAAAQVGTRLHVAPDATHLLVHVDTHRMVQVLVNLLGNAVKFSDPGSCVTVEVLRTEGEAVLCVADTGRGIPPEKLDTVFERFAQVEAGDARRNSGTGLGLAIARELVERSDGRIEVSSVLGIGSRFTVILPARRQGEPE